MTIEYFLYEVLPIIIGFMGGAFVLHAINKTEWCLCPWCWNRHFKQAEKGEKIK